MFDDLKHFLGEVQLLAQSPVLLIIQVSLISESLRTYFDLKITGITQQ